MHTCNTQCTMESMWTSNMSHPVPMYSGLLMPYQYAPPDYRSMNYNQTFPLPLHHTTWFSSPLIQPYTVPMTSTQITPPAETICCKQEPKSPPPEHRSPCRRESPHLKRPSSSSSSSASSASSAAAVAVPRNGFASESNPEYVAFRDEWLEMMRVQNGGSLTVDNPRMRRYVHRSSEARYDENYAERRARNNAAAKRSRDQRKYRSHELMIKVMYLERKKADMMEKLKKKKSCSLCRYKCLEMRSDVDHQNEFIV